MHLSKRAIVIAGVLASTVGAAFAQSPGTPPPGPGLALINERCAACHPVTQVYQARKSRADWTTTVQAMIDRGADLSPEEQGVVVDYLATNFAPSGAPAAAPAPTSKP